uniref:Ca(2+)/calmodulin-dependent protein kinase phosphatase n=1 Tax=Rhipicephalus zambeziensis TaxID=60191 RepID=A0A224YTM5_9ACAR
MEERSITEYLSSYSNVNSPESPDDGVQHRNGHQVERTIDPEDVEAEVFDWVLTHLEPRQWPLSLSTVLAKTVAHQMNTSLKLKAGGYTDEDLAVSRLRATALEALAEQCALWREQPELAQELPHTPATSLPLSSYGVRNNRRKMEDRHLALPDLNFALGLQGLPQYSYYAVFDGHAGVEAADYATAHLHRNIAAQPDFVTDPVNAVREGFLLTDRNFLQRSSREGLKSGCTAVCCLVREQRQLVVGWLGDSQAILARKGVPVPLVNPHKPEREDERKRIEDLGGVVLLMGIWRVNGALGVSRAIGDAEHKPFVTSEPDVVSMDLDGTEDFLVLGCDGLWDQLSPKNVASRVYHAVLEDPESAPYVSHTLVQTARDMGSSDNITAVVVFLRDPRDFEPSVLDIVDFFPKPVPGSELPTPPVEDKKEAFNSSEFDASRFNSNGYGAHLFDAEAVNSHTYEHAPESEILQVASDVVQGTIETALHRVNEDVITAGQIVDQVHLLHTEESGKFSDLPEQFHGAVPADGSLEDKFDQPDGISHAANGYGDNIPVRQAVHHNPFDDEGYGHDLETAECLQSSGIAGALEESGTESVEQFSSFAEGANEASSSQLEMLHEQTFCTAPSLTPQHHEFDASSDQEVDARQPSPVGQHMLPQDPLLAAADLAGAPAEPETLREAELPDEGVDVSTLPEDVQEMEAAKEQPVASAIQDECLSKLPEDQQDFKLAQTCDMDSVALPDAAEQVAEVVDTTHAVHDAETLDVEHSDNIHGNMPSPGNIQEEVQQLDHFYGDVRQSDLNKEEIQSAQPLEPEHVKDGTETGMTASGLSYNQPLSIQSDDLVSIDLNSSAMQSLAEASAPPHAADNAFICETVPEPHQDMSMAYVESEDAHHDQPVCETLESLGTDDADDTSLGGSAESIVEKVTAEPGQQDSAVIFCELKESPPAENILDEQADKSEQKVDNLCYNIPVEQQEQVQAEVFNIGPQVESSLLSGQVSEPFAEDSFAVPPNTESLHILEHPPAEPSLQSADSQLQAESQQLATTAISPVSDVEQPCAPLNQNLSEEAESPLLQSQSPAMDELLEQNSAALNEVHCMSENTKPTVDETLAPVVDIGAIPENIPEADGVTEDSDSERDNEWRFVKPVEPVISQLAKEAGEVLIQGSRAAEETIHAEQKEATSSELVQSPAETSASEPKVDALPDTKQDLLPETKSEVAAAQKQDTLPEQKASAAKVTPTAKPSPAAQKTKPAAKASPAPKPRTPSTDKPATKPLPTKTEASAKATLTAKSPLKKQPVTTKPTTAATTTKQSSTASSAAKTSLTRKPEPPKPKSSAPATDAPAKKPVPASSRLSTGSARPTASKPPEKSTTPASKAKPTAPSSTAPRPRTSTGSALTSASKAEVGTEKKPTSKPAPTRPPISRTAPKSTQPTSSSSAPRVGSSTTASRPTTAPTSRPGTTSRVGSASAATKKTSDAGPAAAKTSSARVPATRDAKLGKDSTNQQLAGARRTETTQRSAAGRTATASKTAAAKPTATSKYAAVRAVPKGGAAAAAAAAAAKAAAAENQSKGEPAANCNGTPEEKGTLEQKDNKEACVPTSEQAILSNGSHPESDEIAKPAAVADMPDAPAVDV